MKDIINTEVTLLCPEKFYGGSIPKVLTISALDTALELHGIGNENFDRAMITKILPSVVSPAIDANKLTEIDYFWLLRNLRFISYGPHAEVDRYICPKCGWVFGTKRVDLRKVEVIPVPEDIEPIITIKEYPFCKGEVCLRFPRRSDYIMIKQDKRFSSKDGENHQLTRFGKFCACLKSIGNEYFSNYIDSYEYILSNLKDAATRFLLETWKEKTTFGVTIKGKCECETCGEEGVFFVDVDERFFHPTVGDLSAWVDGESAGGKERSN